MSRLKRSTSSFSLHMIFMLAKTILSTALENRNAQIFSFHAIRYKRYMDFVRVGDFVQAGNTTIYINVIIASLGAYGRTPTIQFTKFPLLSPCKDPEEWGYVDKTAWKGTCKTGKLQSPIDLDISEAILVKWEPLKFHNYDARGDIVAENNGHTELVQGFQSWTKRPYITGGNLKGKYKLQQFHFHCNGNDRFGSEHTLEGLHYPMEVHFVHIKEGLNETTAHHVTGGVAVVAVQFQIATQGEALFDLEKVTEDTNSSYSKADVPSYSPGSLLPRDTSTFFRYTGSLTTPPCSEGVIWTVLAHPNFVTDTQLRILRRHLKEDDSLLIDNWRTVQPMNGRKLYLNKGAVIQNEVDTSQLWDVTSKTVPIMLMCVVFVIIIV